MRGKAGLLLLVGVSASSNVACGGTDNRKAAEGGFENGGFKVDGGIAADACTAAAKLVYVLSSDDDLYAFAPSQLVFTKIGRLQCPVQGTPNSMAIDRTGTAWVNYTGGDLVKVSTSDATCTKTQYVTNQNNVTMFGMAFATTGAGSDEETLFISGLTAAAGGGKGLGRIDLNTLQLTMLGDYSDGLTGRGAELTGTGDGRLYGFFTTTPYATLAQVDPSRGATSNDKSLNGVNTGLAWAFSFWGGDFWFYTSDGTRSSNVTQLKTSGELAVAKDDVGFRIVGAGVSTCAPTSPPR
jgi:hypothetical protein